MKIELKFDTVFEGIHKLLYAEKVMNRKPSYILLSEDMCARFILEHFMYRKEYEDKPMSVKNMIGSSILGLPLLITTNKGYEYINVISTLSNVERSSECEDDK